MNRLITRFNAVLLLLLFFTTIVLISNNFSRFGQSNENTSEQMSTTQAVQMNGGQIEGNTITPVTEWLGIFTLRIVTGFLVFNTKISDNVTSYVKRRKIILSVAILSLRIVRFTIVF
jgi:phosphoglycerol transferase MdoB-like AlkP superfamily enzyme